MALVTTGLKTYIWNNNLKSMILLAAYPFVIMALIWVCAFVAAAVGEGAFGPVPPENFATSIIYEFWPTILTLVVIWFTVAFFFHTNMIRRLAKSHPVTRKDEPELYNLLENLSIARGIPMPRLEIIETHARNAFASGISPKTYTVTVTRGLMNSLSKDELEAVLAHELTHILNRDVRLLVVTVIFTGMIGFAAQLAWSSIRYSIFMRAGNRGRGGGLLIVLAVALILWIGYLATLMMRFAISRRREYMADAGAVELTKNPQAMMRALLRIAGKDRMPAMSEDIAMMCTENHKRFLGLFATHPPIESRIKAIAEITGTPRPDTNSLPPVEKPARYIPQRPHPKNPWVVIKKS